MDSYAILLRSGMVRKAHYPIDLISHPAAAPATPRPAPKWILQRVSGTDGRWRQPHPLAVPGKSPGRNRVMEDTAVDKLPCLMVNRELFTVALGDIGGGL